jgi:hypothetical protein
VLPNVLIPLGRRRHVLGVQTAVFARLIRSHRKIEVSSAHTTHTHTRHTCDFSSIVARKPRPHTHRKHSSSEAESACKTHLSVVR